MVTFSRITRVFSTIRRMVIFLVLVTLTGPFIIHYLYPSTTVQAATLGVRLNEVMSGANGNSKVQFIEIEAQDSTQKCWGPQQSGDACFTGTPETAGRLMLLFFDAAGIQTGRYVFPNNPGGTQNTVLIATQDFANLAGAPVPDFILPAREISANDGQVCVRGNPDNPNAPSLNLCLAYGAFTGPQQNNARSTDPIAGPFTGTPNGTPASNPLSITSTFSYNIRVTTFGDLLNSNYRRLTAASPRNTAGQTFTFPTATVAQIGEALFFNETFNGNGRTCGTCHVAEDFYGLTPASVASRDPFDPLFVAEYNLNMLTLTTRSQPSDLRGVVTASNGVSFTVLGGSETGYQVYGGDSSLVGKTLTDGKGNTATVSSFTTGDLNTLEDPRLMHIGRALILVNPDGFTNPAVARAAPHLANILFTAPYPQGGQFETLNAFVPSAITQHYTKRIARVAGVDFRVPTTEEVNDLVTFMNAIVLPADGDFTLSRFVTTEAQKRGNALFHSDFNNGFNCDTCHENLVMAAHDKFNTQVGLLPINDRNHDNLPRDVHEITTPPMFGIRFTAPYEHDNSIATLRDAVAFYGGTEFQNGPDGFLVNPAFFADPKNIDDVVAFLESLVEPVADFTRTINFGNQEISQGQSAPQTVSVTNISTQDLTIVETKLNAPGAPHYVITSLPPATSFAPGTTETMQVAFDPSVTGLITATLEFTATTPDNTTYAMGVALSGTGTNNVNTPPTISDIPNQGVNEDNATAALAFTIGDAETLPDNLVVTGSSSNTTLIPNANIVLGGSGTSRTVTLTPAANQNGAATITITVSDGNLSASDSFILTVNPVNDPPSFTAGAAQTVLEDSGAKTVTGWATAISAGPADEAGQTLTFNVTVNQPALFSAQPAISANGTLTFTPAPNRFGAATLTITLQDNGGTANGGADTSAPVTLRITLTGVNDVPTFTPGANQSVPINSGAQSVRWARNVSPGPFEGTQIVNFIVTNDNNALFAVQPAISATGTLTYTPAAGMTGTASVTTSLHDDGGTANGGVDTSAPVTFTITLTP